MKCTTERTGEHVPEWNGNRALPADEQILVTWTNLSWETRKRYLKTSAAKIVVRDAAKKSEAEIDEDVEKQLESIEQTFQTDVDGIVRASEVKLAGLEIDGAAVDTWEKLIKIPDSAGLKVSALIQEIREVVGNRTKEPHRKN
jgi:hypothetical protein